MIMTEEQHKQNLNEARRNDSANQRAKLPVNNAASQTNQPSNKLPSTASTRTNRANSATSNPAKAGLGAKPSGKNALGSSAKEVAQNLMGAFSLAKQIRLDDLIFIIPVGAAILKDISDFAIVGSIPGIGTVLSLSCSITIGLYSTLLTSSGTYQRARGNGGFLVKKMFTLIFGTLFEFLFGVNFLPGATLTVLAIYIMTLQERQQSDQNNDEDQEVAYD